MDPLGTELVVSLTDSDELCAGINWDAIRAAAQGFLKSERDLLDLDRQSRDDLTLLNSDDSLVDELG